MFEIDEWQPSSAPPPLSLAEITDDPDQAAAWLAVEAPGPDAVAALSLLDPAGLSHGGRVDALVALERHLAWLAGMQAQVLAVMAADDPSEDRWVREEVGCALRLSALTAQRRLAVARNPDRDAGGDGAGVTPGPDQLPARDDPRRSHLRARR